MSLADCHVSDATQSLENRIKVIRCKKDAAFLVCALTVALPSCFVSTMLGPFIPSVGSKKGVSPTAIGFILSCDPITHMLLSPFGSRVIKWLGVKRTILGGLLVSAISLILQGFTSHFTNPTLFTSSLILLRVIMAAGDTFSVVSGVTIIVRGFKHRLSFVMGMYEALTGFSFVIAPLYGAGLYTVGGFPAPFLTTAFLTSGIMLVQYFLQPKLEDDSNDKEHGILLKVLKIPAVLVIGIGGVLYMVAGGALEPVAVFHFKVFNFSATEVGLMFVLPAALYCLGAPICGALIRPKYYRSAFVCGLLITAISQFLLGPSPFFGDRIPRALWIDAVALALLGIGLTPCVIVAVADLCLSAEIHGMPEGVTTDGIISGLLECFLSVGAAVGPSIGGILYDAVGFSWTTTIIGLMLIAYAIVVTVFTGWEKKLNKHRKALEVEQNTAAEKSSVERETRI